MLQKVHKAASYSKWFLFLQVFPADNDPLSQLYFLSINFTLMEYCLLLLHLWASQWVNLAILGKLHF